MAFSCLRFLSLLSMSLSILVGCSLMSFLTNSLKEEAERLRTQIQLYHLESHQQQHSVSLNLLTFPLADGVKLEVLDNQPTRLVFANGGVTETTASLQDRFGNQVHVKISSTGMVKIYD